jgi:deoxyribonuclease IV
MIMRVTPSNNIQEMPIRVREILDGLKGTGRRPLLKYIPKVTLPSDTKGLFPNMILSSLPYDQKYSLVGLITESLVLGSEPLTNDSPIEELAKLGVTLDETVKAKIKKSKTTTDYIKKIEKTREVLKEKLTEFNGEGPYEILLNQELTYDCVEGHPDGICGKTVMEVKTSSKLDEDINYFMLQLCAYAALGDGYYSQAILVLPLQQTVIAIDVRMWPKRKYFRGLLVSKAKNLILAKPEIDAVKVMTASLLVEEYGIGSHTKKAPSLLQTVEGLSPNIPYQIFLGGNQNTRLSVKDDDIVAAAEYLEENNIVLYIHSPYLINLSGTSADNWQIEYLQRLLQYGATLGAKGVVVHTGKHTSDKYEVGVEKMRNTIKSVLTAGSPGCPLLLETPAGQGTETLQDQNEFLEFVASFESQNIAVCVDTCHVFANGHDPLDYVKAAYNTNMLRLVHFNDSSECCGSCKDRHAMVGMGQIGLEKMTKIAEFCGENRIDMLIE